MMISSPELVETILRLGVALVLGSAIGFERQWNQKMAGLRTNALVALGSCGFVVFSTMVGQGDPTRVAGQVVSGIGFLGAGVIMKEGFTIRGLSTAASIWMTAAIGVIIGIGFYGAAISATVVMLTAMTALGQLEKVLPHQTTLHLSLVYPNDHTPSADDIRERMKRHGFAVIDWSFHYCESSNHFQYDLVLQAVGECQSHNLVGDLSRSHEVVEFRLAPSRA